MAGCVGWWRPRGRRCDLAACWLPIYTKIRKAQADSGHHVPFLAHMVNAMSFLGAWAARLMPEIDGPERRPAEYGHDGSARLTVPSASHRTVPVEQPYRYGPMSQKKATPQAVEDACRKLLEEGKPLSAANILARVGGSKRTVLEERKVVLAKLTEEGRAIDPSAAFHAAADPLLRKLWILGRQHAEASFAERIRDLGTIKEGLELDVDALQESLEEAQRRAESAEVQLAEILRNYDDLREAFKVLAASVKPEGDRSGSGRATKPSPRETAGVLTALERLSGSATHEELYAEMAKDGWDDEAAHKARFRVMGARLAEHVIVPTQSGRERAEKARGAR